jgi:hypothetical protein
MDQTVFRLVISAKRWLLHRMLAKLNTLQKDVDELYRYGVDYGGMLQIATISVLINSYGCPIRNACDRP